MILLHNSTPIANNWRYKTSSSCQANQKQWRQIHGSIHIINFCWKLNAWSDQTILLIHTEILWKKQYTSYPAFNEFSYWK